MKRILYIDKEENVEVLNNYLKEKGWMLYLVNNIDIAKDIVEKSIFPVIAISFEFIQEENFYNSHLYKVASLNNSLFIMLDSDITLEKTMQAMKIGIHDVIVKPIKPAEFINSIEKAFSLWQSKKDSEYLLTVLKEKVEELEKSISDLKKEKMRLLSFLKEMSDAVILMNSFGKVVLVNVKAMQLFNIIIKDNKIICESTEFEQIVKKMREALNKKESTSFQFSMGDIRKNYYNIVINTINVENNTEICAIISDVTEIIKNYEIRSNFIGKISHELRTPVSNIKSAAQFLKKKLYLLEDNTKNFIDIIEQEADHLLEDINNIFDFSSLSSQQIDLDMNKNDLNELLNKLLKELSLIYQDKEINLEVKLPTFIKDFLFDKDKLGKAIRKVLENAFKYTPNKGFINVAGEVFQSFAAIKSKYYTERDINTKVPFFLIAVKDNGPGIEVHELEKIFEPFYQAENIFEHKDGTGLGLYICKCIIEAHGGTIWAHSKLKEGSTFYIAIPIIGELDRVGTKAFFKMKD